MVTNVYVKFNYDRLRMYKALGNFQKSDNSNNNKNKKNVRSAWGPYPGPKREHRYLVHVFRTY